MIKFFRKLKAFLLRTFVTNCPKCHKHFYGTQRYGLSVVIEDKSYRIVCHTCLLKHEEGNQKKLICNS